MATQEEIDVSHLNIAARKVGFHDDELDHKWQQELKAAYEATEEYIDQRAAGWESVGLSERESSVAAYRELGFTNRAVAYFLGLSPSTIGEYQSRIQNKIEDAQALLNRAGAPPVVGVTDRYVNCSNCGHRTQRSKADIVWNTGEEQAMIRCYGCFESPDDATKKTPRLR